MVHLGKIFALNLAEIIVYLMDIFVQFWFLNAASSANSSQSFFVVWTLYVKYYIFQMHFFGTLKRHFYVFQVCTNMKKRVFFYLNHFLKWSGRLRLHIMLFVAVLLWNIWSELEQILHSDDNHDWAGYYWLIKLKIAQDTEEWSLKKINAQET